MKRVRSLFSLLLSKRFLRYATVGALGTAIDVGVLWSLVTLSGINPKESMLLYAFTSIAFFVAFLNNYFLNKIWTFEVKEKKYALRQFIKFGIASLIGLCFANMFMWLFVVVLSVALIPAKLLTSCFVLGWNFFANNFWTFRTRVLHKRAPERTQFGVELSIVIPAYNEEKRIQETLKKIGTYMENFGVSYEILVVDDGSTDATVSVIETMQLTEPFSRTLRLIRSKENFGKGSAVTIGMLSGRGRYLLFTDADNSTPIEELEGFYAQRERADILIGSRYLSESQVHIRQPWYRVFIGRMANFCIRIFLVDSIKDTQCGFKLFRNDVARDIFARMNIERFGFDMEALALAELLGYSVRELPVDWYNSSDSRVRPLKDTWRTLVDLIYIKLMIWTGKYKKEGEMYESDVVDMYRHYMRRRLLQSIAV